MLCVSTSVELLGPMSPQFSNPDTQSPRFKIRLTPLHVSVFLLHFCIFLGLYHDD